MKYKIVSSRNIEILEKDVNRFIERGYIPQGGVVINGMVYAQAMVK